MTLPHYVYVFCGGRLANQLIAWAHGRLVTSSIPNRRLLMDFAPLADRCTMPHTDFVQNVHPAPNLNEWPMLATASLACADSHCWWTEAWENRPPMDVVVKYLRDVEFDPALIATANTLIGGNPFIGVHIRYGDYVAIDEANPPLVRPPFVRLPNSYYSDRVNALQKAFPDWKVFLATNGTDEEVKWFTNAYEVNRQPKNDGLLDFITLSKCRIVVASDSTFSPLAAGLGEISCIHPTTPRDALKDLMRHADTPHL